MSNYQLTEAYGCTFVSYEPEEATRTTYVVSVEGVKLPALHCPIAAEQRAKDECAEARTWASVTEVHHFPSGISQEGEVTSFSFNEETNKVEQV